MWREEHKPLSLGVWLAELDKLAEYCAGEIAEREDLAVRRAFYLSKLAPMAVRRLQRPSASESDVENALDRGEAVQAAKIVAGEAVCVSVAPAEAEGRHKAILTPETDEPVEFEAFSDALAIVGAWAKFLKTVQPN